MTAATPRDGEYRALMELSAALGADPLLTQAAGGNTSIKLDGVMWIKASGKWLAHATSQNIMTPVAIEALRQAVANGDPRAESAVDFIDPIRNSLGLRPSIETSVHAVIPSPVVVHIHCVNTIALAVRRDGEKAALGRLEGAADIESVFIPYRKPGLSLARAISERLRPGANVLILANHGLVVAGDTVAETADRTRRVCEAFAAPARPFPEADLPRLAALIEGGDYRLPEDSVAHALALDATSLAFARRGSLYPDHVVFLGPGIVEARAAGGRLVVQSDPDRTAPMLVLPGVGVVLHRSAPSSADAMARCLADVAARIPEDASVCALTAAQELELVNWEAEKYRQSLNKPAGAA
jgi:rhamnose utilization protein RhaD (predicted bifunctional aldolase and dehydrogenase)